MSQLKSVISLICAAGLGLGVAVVAYSASDREDALKERLKPAGEICMAGDDCASATVVVASSGPRSGEDVYNAACTTCHATGLSGAPKIGVAGDWSPRLSKGMETLYTNAIKGFNAMPAKGLCMDCSDDEIKASVDHMLNNSK